MKKVFFSILSLTTLFIACKKDSSTNTPSQVKVANVKYEVLCSNPVFDTAIVVYPIITLHDTDSNGILYSSLFGYKTLRDTVKSSWSNSSTIKYKDPIRIYLNSWLYRTPITEGDSVTMNIYVNNVIVTSSTRKVEANGTYSGGSEMIFYDLK